MWILPPPLSRSLKFQDSKQNQHLTIQLPTDWFGGLEVGWLPNYLLEPAVPLQIQATH